MRASLRASVQVAAPAGQVWGYLTDWPRQGEWIPFTRVEELADGHRVGGLVQATGSVAWSGPGRAWARSGSGT
jgi:hypothetical protein